MFGRRGDETTSSRLVLGCIGDVCPVIPGPRRDRLSRQPALPPAAISGAVDLAKPSLADRGQVVDDPTWGRARRAGIGPQLTLVASGSGLLAGLVGCSVRDLPAGLGSHGRCPPIDAMDDSAGGTAGGGSRARAEGYD